MYRITISEEIMTKYFSSIDQKTQQPSVPLVLFVKHLRDNDITTFNNETTIHMDITRKITDPISPSILHYETIKEDITKEEEWKEKRRDRTGLPWYKNPAMRESARQGG